MSFAHRRPASEGECTPMLVRAQLVLQYGVGIVFLLSGVTKAAHPKRFARAVTEYRVLPAKWSWPFAIVLVFSELWIGFAHLFGVQLHETILLSQILLFAFLAAVLLVLRRGISMKCACFSSSSEEVVGRTTLARLLLLIGAEGALFCLARPIQIDYFGEQWIIDMTAAALSLVLIAWLFATGVFSVLMRECVTCGTPENS